MNIEELRERIRQWKVGEFTPGGYEEAAVAVESAEVAEVFDGDLTISSSEEVSPIEPDVDHQVWATGSSPAPSAFEFGQEQVAPVTDEHVVEDAHQHFAEQEMLAAGLEQQEQAVEISPAYAEQADALEAYGEQPIEEVRYDELPLDEEPAQQASAEQPEQGYAEQLEQAEHAEQYISPEPQYPQVEYAPRGAGAQPLNQTVPGYPQIDQAAVAGESPVPSAGTDDDGDSGTFG